MAFTPEQHRAHRAKLKAKGICIRCHKRPIATTAVCQECREIINNDTYRNKARWRKTPDTCGDCGRPTKGRFRCPMCAKTAARCTRRKSKKYKLEGKCQTCGCKLPDGLTYNCAVCTGVRTIAQNLRRAVRGRVHQA